MPDLFTTLSCLTACWQEDESDFLPGVYVCGNNGVIDEYLNSSHRRSILFLRQRSGRLTGFSCSEVGWRKTGRILRLSFVQRTILEENLKTVALTRFSVTVDEQKGDYVSPFCFFPPGPRPLSAARPGIGCTLTVSSATRGLPYVTGPVDCSGLTGISCSRQ